MPEPVSPCGKVECINKNKMECADGCKELAEYQRYLESIHDPYRAQVNDFKPEVEVTILSDITINNL